MPTNRVLATAFYRFMESGRTSPAILGCEGLDYGNDGEYVVKLKGGCDFGTSQLVRELAAAHLADYFGLPHPQFALVEIEADLARLVARETPAKAALIEKSVGTNFGTKMMNGLRRGQWIECLLPVNLRPLAMSSVSTCLYAIPTGGPITLTWERWESRL